jgi:photosystem II stability/assembly factor-like uncharacterized protein
MKGIVFLALVLAAGCGGVATGSSVALVGLGGAVAGSDGGALQLHQLGASVDLWSLASRGQLSWAVGDAGAIFHSADGGAHFSAQTSGTPSPLRGVAFADEQRGIAIGALGVILSTENGGQSWTTMPANGKEMPSAATANGNSWWVGSANGGLWQSTDGAMTFVKQVVPPGTFRSIAFAADTKTGFAVGDAGVVIGTSDGGASWTQRPTAPSDLRAVAIAPAGDEVIAVGGAGVVWRSSDSGVTWRSVVVSSAARLYGVTFASASGDAWIVGESGTILRAPAHEDAFTAVSGPSATTWTSVVDAR